MRKFIATLTGVALALAGLFIVAAPASAAQPGFAKTPANAITIEYLGANDEGVNVFEVCNPPYRGDAIAKTVYWQYAGALTPRGTRPVIAYGYLDLAPEECEQVAIGTNDDIGYQFSAADVAGTGGGKYKITG